MKVAIHTLGCKVNQYETAALEGLLRAQGHELVSFESTADAYIINTCTVTAVSDKKSRQMIRAARRRNPEAVVAVCGCYAQTNPEAVRALGVDLIAGTGDRQGFVKKLLQIFVEGREEEPRYIVDDDMMSPRIFEPLSADGMEGRTRAYLKVEDGCVNFCTYCIIPYARGPVRSLPLEDAVSEARRLQKDGYRELILTGIEISSWGQDLEDGTKLIDLLEGVCRAAPGCRVRLGSLEPRTITEEFCARAAQLRNLCPHFHLSMQSGSDGVLRRMNRKYDTRRYYESVQLLRGFFDRPGITTDLIVGFPGETDAEFSETLAFIKKCGFSAMHIFPYSRRTGTPAAKHPDQILNVVKEARAHTAGAAAAEMKRNYLEQWLGASLPVLFEEEKDGLWRGHAPNYVEVYAEGETLHNEERTVTITGLFNGGLRGE